MSVGLKNMFKIFECFESQLEKGELYSVNSKLLKCFMYEGDKIKTVSEFLGMYPRENSYRYIESRVRIIMAAVCVNFKNWK